MTKGAGQLEVVEPSPAIDSALRLARYFGGDAEWWLNLHRKPMI
jgi:plasmid maintenance system antidote protein VapI